MCSRAARGAALRRASVAAVLLFVPGACDESFEFDVPAAGGMSGGGGVGGPGPDKPGGMAGTAPLGGGASSGGASSSGASSGGGAAIVGDGGGSDDAEPCAERGVCPSGLHCADGECRACAADSDCLQSGLARCDLTRYRCVACILSTDCAEGFRCDALANRCLATCREPRDCPETAHGCNARRGVCYACDDDRECAASSLGKFCAVDGSGCVQCRNDADCDAALCDLLTGRCVECRDGLDCISGLCDPLAQTCLPEA